MAYLICDFMHDGLCEIGMYENVLELGFQGKF